MLNKRINLCDLISKYSNGTNTIFSIGAIVTLGVK